MRTFLFRCPNTGLNVQAYTAEDVEADDVFETLHCVACKQAHLVNPKTGRVAGADE